MAILLFNARNRVFEFSSESSSGYWIQSYPLPEIVVAGSVSDVQSVAENATSATIQHNMGDATTGILILPSWNTTVWYTSLGANAATVYFATPASADAVIYWEAFASMPTVSVTQDEISVVITHSQNDIAVPLFVTPNWNTTVWDSTADRTADTATVFFSSPAPASAELVYKVGT